MVFPNADMYLSIYVDWCWIGVVRLLGNTRHFGYIYIIHRVRSPIYVSTAIEKEIGTESVRRNNIVPWCPSDKYLEGNCPKTNLRQTWKDQQKLNSKQAQQVNLISDVRERDSRKKPSNISNSMLIVLQPTYVHNLRLALRQVTQIFQDDRAKDFKMLLVSGLSSWFCERQGIWPSTSLPMVDLSLVIHLSELIFLKSNLERSVGHFLMIHLWRTCFS